MITTFEEYNHTKGTIDILIAEAKRLQQLPNAEDLQGYVSEINIKVAKLKKDLIEYDLTQIT